MGPAGFGGPLRAAACRRLLLVDRRRPAKPGVRFQPEFSFGTVPSEFRLDCPSRFGPVRAELGRQLERLPGAPSPRQCLVQPELLSLGVCSPRFGGSLFRKRSLLPPRTVLQCSGLFVPAMERGLLGRLFRRLSALGLFRRRLARRRLDGLGSALLGRRFLLRQLARWELVWRQLWGRISRWWWLLRRRSRRRLRRGAPLIGASERGALSGHSPSDDAMRTSTVLDFLQPGEPGHGICIDPALYPDWTYLLQRLGPELKRWAILRHPPG